MSVHQNNPDKELRLDHDAGVFDNDNSSPLTIDFLSSEKMRMLKGCISYWDFKNLGIGQVNSQFSRGIIACDHERDARAIFVANQKHLFKYTISGNDQYGFSATYTDKTAEHTDVYLIGGAELARFSYQRGAINTDPNQSELEACLVALEKCGYEELRLKENNPTRRGWLSGAISLLK
jgi:hypothetical protein